MDLSRLCLMILLPLSPPGHRLGRGAVPLPAHPHQVTAPPARGSGERDPPTR